MAGAPPGVRGPPTAATAAAAPAPVAVPQQLPTLSPFELPLTRPHRTVATYQTPAADSLWTATATTAVPPSLVSSAGFVPPSNAAAGGGGGGGGATRNSALATFLSSHQQRKTAAAQSSGGPAVDAMSESQRQQLLQLLLARKSSSTRGGGVDMTNLIVDGSTPATAHAVSDDGSESAVHRSLQVELPAARGGAGQLISTPLPSATSTAGGAGVGKHVILPSPVPLHSRHLPVQHQPATPAAPPPAPSYGTGGGHSRRASRHLPVHPHSPSVHAHAMPVVGSTVTANAISPLIHPNMNAPPPAPAPTPIAVEPTPPTPRRSQSSAAPTPHASSAPAPTPAVPKNLPAGSVALQTAAPPLTTTLSSLANASANPTAGAGTAIIPVGGTTAPLTVSDAEARALLPPAYSLPAGYMIVRARTGATTGTDSGGGGGGVAFTINAHDSAATTASTIEALNERIDVRTRMLRLFKALMSDLKVKLEHDKNTLEAAHDHVVRTRDDRVYSQLAAEREFRQTWNEGLKSLKKSGSVNQTAGAASTTAAAATSGSAADPEPEANANDQTDDASEKSSPDAKSDSKTISLSPRGRMSFSRNSTTTPAPSAAPNASAVRRSALRARSPSTALTNNTTAAAGSSGSQTDRTHRRRSVTSTEAAAAAAGRLHASAAGVVNADSAPLSINTAPTPPSTAPSGGRTAAGQFKAMRNRMGYQPSISSLATIGGSANGPLTADGESGADEGGFGSSAAGSLAIPTSIPSGAAGTASPAKPKRRKPVSHAAAAIATSPSGAAAVAGATAAAEALAAAAAKRRKQAALQAATGGAAGNSAVAAGRRVRAEALFPHTAALRKSKQKNKSGANAAGGGAGNALSSGAPVKLLASFKASVRGICVVREQVWAAMRDGTVVVYQLKTAQPLHRLTINGHVWCVAGVRGQVWLGMDAGPVLIYDPSTFALVQAIRAHAGGIYTIVNTPYGVFSGSNDFTVHAWTHESITAPNASANPSAAAAATAAATAPRARVRAVYYGHSNGVRCIVAPSARAMWSGGDDGSIRVWNTETAESVSELLGHSGSVLSLVNTGHAMWSCGEDGTIRSWSLVAPFTSLASVSMDRLSRVSRLLLVGRHVWSCGEDPRIHVWDAKNMTLIKTLSGHKTYTNSMTRVKTVESRVVWSSSMGEETVCVWQSNEREVSDSITTAGPDSGNATTIDDSADLRAVQRAETALLHEQVTNAERVQRAAPFGVGGDSSKESPTRAQERSAFSTELERLVMMLAEHEIRSQEQASNLNAALQQNTLLRSELAALRGVVSVEREHSEQLTIQLEAKDDKISRLIDDFKLQLAAAYTQNSKTAAATQRALADSADQTRARTSVEHELETAKARIAELERSLAALHAERAISEERHAHSEHTNDALRTHIKAQTRLFVSTNADAEDQKKANESLQSHLQRMNDESNELRGELNRLHGALHESESNHNTAQTHITELRSELDAASERHTLASALATRHVQRLQTELNNATAVNLQLRTVNAGVTAVVNDVSAIGRRCAQISTAIDALQRTTTVFNIESLASYADRQKVWQLLSGFHAELIRIGNAVRALIARTLPAEVKLHIGHTTRSVDGLDDIKIGADASSDQKLPPLTAASAAADDLPPLPANAIPFPPLQPPPVVGAASPFKPAGASLRRNN